MESKKTLFISHSAPQDNYIALWLAAKLKLLGYDVWVDIEDLRSGSSFWPKIENTIRNKTVKFLAIVTSSYIEKSRTPKSGVLAEIMCATSIDEENFIIPIKCDSSIFSDFPVKFLEFNGIDFSSNFGAGLKLLVNELIEANIPNDNEQKSVIKEWFAAQNISTELIERDENYYSSWFKAELPQYVYVHYPVEDFKLLGELIPYSFIRNGDFLIGFFSNNELSFESSFSQKIPINNFYEEKQFVLDNGEIIIDPNNKLVNLLNKSFASYLISEGFRYYEKSNRKRIYYFPYSSEWSGFISLKKFGKRGRTIFGKHKNLRWRFAISYNFQLHPIPYLNTQYHLVFSDEDGLLDQASQQKYRRSMPKDWFNRPWFERLLAILYHLSRKSEDKLISIEVDNQIWNISVSPIEFISKVGYIEPNENN
ncbi:MAG: toll/interleukin-1 receptor domain-containing protein [Promethearchaeota archaeon]